MARTLTIVPRWAGHSGSDFHPWLIRERPPGFDTVRALVLLSDDDPFTSDYRENGRLWEERLGAEVVLVPGARHFNDEQEPAVLDALRLHFPEPLNP